MLKPSDFNNAVPQFQNGNYASNPINPQYVEEPSSTDYNRGTEPLQTLPAQWWNWFMNKFTSRFNKVNIYVKNLFNELAQLLSLVNVTPDGTEGAVTDGQLKNAFKELYPDYINTKLALEATYVKKTQKVNNHALSGDVTVTKSDVDLGNVPNVSTNDQTPTYTEASSLTALSSGEKLSIAFGKLAKAVSSLISHINNTNNPHSVTKAQVGLGNVVNTGDSATPVENGTTKFTTGGAYTLKKDLTDIAESLPTDAVLHYSFDEVPDYPDGSADCRYSDGSTYNIQGTSVGFNSNGGTVFSNVNGNVQAVITGGAWTGAFLRNTYIQNKIVRLKIEITALTGALDVMLDTNVTLYHFTSVGTYDILELQPTASGNNQLFFFCTGSGNSCTFIVKQIYIGDGSYSTPIIDNANGQNNATNNGGIATKGVSGKGALFFDGKYADIGNYNLADNFSISLWIKPSENESGKIRYLLFKSGVIAIQNGYTNNNFFHVNLTNPTNDNPQFITTSSLLQKDVYNNVICTKNGTNFVIYINGVKVKTQTVDAGVKQNANNLTISSSSNNVSQSIDDLLIFDRALTENEVTALYLNKANTPKYYDINNYILDNPDSTPTQNSINLVTSGGVYTELAKKANTTYVDTELAKKVDKTTTVNGHALSGNVTVTKSDVDLGNVVNTGDSAIPVSGGTTKFTTGGAFDFFGGNTDANAWLAKAFGWAVGKNWTSANLTSPSNSYSFVRFLNGIFIANSDDGNVAWSLDGKNWTLGTMNVKGYFEDAYYANGLWVACGSTYTGPSTWWSTDGKSWIQGTHSSQNGWYNSIYYANGLWELGTQYDGVWWSTDGKTFTKGTGGLSSLIVYGIEYANEIWVACTASGGIYWSNNGKNWTVSNINDNTFSDVKYINTSEGTAGSSAGPNGIWISVGFEGIFTSEDGMTWDTTSVTTNCSQIYYANRTIIVQSADGNNRGIFKSVDGYIWRNVYPNARQFLLTESFVYANGIWIAVDARDGLYVSNDAENWSRIYQPGSVAAGNICYGNNVFVRALKGPKLLWSDYTNIIWQ